MSRNGSFEIRKWMDRDIKCAELFSCICNVTREDAINFSGISKHRLDTFINMHFITEEFIDDIIYYRTTITGRKVFEEVTSIKGYVSNSYYHDKALYDIYTEISENERNSWRTESEQREYASSHQICLDGASVTDGAYFSDDGEWKYVEVITKHYTEEMKEQKLEYVSRMGGKYEPSEI